MDIRFYLDTTGTDLSTSDNESATGAALVQKVLNHFRVKESSEHYFSRYGGELVEGIQFYKDENGLYLKTDTFINGVPATFVDADLPIASVYLYDEGTSGKPQFGVYKDENGNTSAIVDQHKERRQAGRGGFMGEDQCYEDIPGWRIRVTGKDLESVVSLYRAFRNSKITPVEAWDDLSVDLKEAQEKLREELTRLLGNPASANVTN